MKEIKINIDEEKLDRIKKYVEKGRFKDLDDFFDQSSKLLLYAEDKKEEFGMILPKNTSTKKV